MTVVTSRMTATPLATRQLIVVGRCVDLNELGSLGHSDQRACKAHFLSDLGDRKLPSFRTHEGECTPWKVPP